MEIISKPEQDNSETINNDKIIFLKNFVGYPVEKNTSEEPTFFPEYSEEYLTPVCNWE